MKKEKIQNILKNQDFTTTSQGAFCFLPGDRTPNSTAGKGALGNIQEKIKKYGRLYYFIIYVFSPVFGNQKFQRKFGKLLAKYQNENIIMNIDSGPTYLHARKDVINVDIFDFKEVDIIADAADLPLIENSVDLIFNIAMLEHVPAPQTIIKEMYRVLKKGGEAVCYLPFMVPFHAAPEDYQRWTITGVKNLFSEYEILEIGVGAGPTSAMLWVLQEWLSILFSFRSKILHDIIFLILMIVTAPLKLLNLLLVKFPYAEKIASGFYVIGRKRDT